MMNFKCWIQSDAIPLTFTLSYVTLFYQGFNLKNSGQV